MPESETIRKIARVVHEANRAWCRANGDDSQPSFDDAEPWMIAATEAGVRFRLENPDASVSAQHDQWMSDKMAAGWRYGAIKASNEKTHPMMVPYADLPEMEKRKDALFAAIIAALTKPV